MLCKTQLECVEIKKIVTADTQSYTMYHLNNNLLGQVLKSVLTGDTTHVLNSSIFAMTKTN